MKAFFAALPLLGVLGGCAWHRAPGYSSREALATTPFAPVPWTLCPHARLCDLEGPRGRVRFTEWDADYVLTGRAITTFTAEYDGATAHCGYDAARPLVCNIDPTPEAGDARLILELRTGCTTGQLWSPARSQVFQTDVVELAGYSSPGVQLSVLDGEGWAFRAESKLWNGFILYSRPGRESSAAEVLAVAALEAFLHGTKERPTECLRH